MWNGQGIRKSMVIAVSVAAALLLAFALAMGVKSTRQTRSLVTAQFNEEQLVIARSLSLRIERELNRLKKEIRLLADDIATALSDSAAVSIKIRQGFLHVGESGLRQMQIADPEHRTSRSYGPLAQASSKIGPDLLSALQDWKSATADAITVSRPQMQPAGLSIRIVTALSGGHRFLIFEIDIARLLAPFLKNVRSGKTGYAWIIDERGSFLYHPMPDFMGKNAFEIRRAKDPAISFAIINFIQKEKMLAGLEGTAWYISGWHRGETGEMKKLIAYTPVQVSDHPPQRWSIAVVAPAAEVEDALQKGFRWQLLLQGFVLSIILLGAGTVLFFAFRWTHLLEDKVAQRTSELKKSEEKYRSLVESAEDFIFTVDDDGRFQSMNSFTANFFGGWPDKFLGKPLSSLFPEDVAQKQDKLVRRVFALGKSAREEFRIEMGESAIWISANFMPIKNETGETATVLCIARDITESKNLENQLINAEKLASLGTLAAGVAHEVNNPLGVILGFCDVLLRKTAKDSQDYEDLKTIERQGLHCKEVVENLLSFARFGESDYGYSDLNQCLTEIIKVVRHNLEMNNIELITQFADDIPLVKSEFRQLEQVFLNLINNAGAAMEGGGSLQIKTDFEKASRKAVVQFQDDGIGIRPEDIDHIYEPFFTTKPEGAGTGLGLFVSYGIISKYGGSIDCASAVESGLGKKRGTLFTIKLLTKPREE